MDSKNWICERCGKPATICHHKKYLNSRNVTDPEISLNWENLECLCIECHNAEHGPKHPVTIFSDNGEILKVKDTQETKNFKSSRESIDDVIKAAAQEFNEET